MGIFNRLFGGQKEPTRGPSLPLDLAKRGWIPHKFPNSNVVVFLPKGVVAAHDPEGVLMGSTTGKHVEFSATLHSGFEDPTDALGFVTHLAEGKGITPQDRGTYRYFYDPTEADKRARAMRFWVIGVPGAAVVVSILCEGETPVSPPLKEVKQEIPHFIGELL